MVPSNYQWPPKLWAMGWAYALLLSATASSKGFLFFSAASLTTLDLPDRYLPLPLCHGILATQSKRQPGLPDNPHCVQPTPYAQGPLLARVSQPGCAPVPHCHRTLGGRCRMLKSRPGDILHLHPRDLGGERSEGRGSLRGTASLGHHFDSML